jgi:hypothetical protein
MTNTDTVFVLIDRDRHLDLKITVFADRETALAEARSATTLYGYREDELTATRRRDGWIYAASSRREADTDNLHVVEAQIAKTP